MNLSDELFEQIVTTLAAGDARTLPAVAGNVDVPRAEQRRAARRFNADQGARVRLVPLTDALAPGPVDVPVQDVSPGGARFVFGGRVGLDEQFVLILPSQDGQVAVLCGVAYWQPVGKGLYAIGAKFDRVLRQGSAQPAQQGTAEMPVRRAV